MGPGFLLRRALCLVLSASLAWSYPAAAAAGPGVAAPVAVQTPVGGSMGMVGAGAAVGGGLVQGAGLRLELAPSIALAQTSLLPTAPAALSHARAAEVSRPVSAAFSGQTSAAAVTGTPIAAVNAGSAGLAAPVLRSLFSAPRGVADQGGEAGRTAVPAGAERSLPKKLARHFTALRRAFGLAADEETPAPADVRSADLREGPAVEPVEVGTPDRSEVAAPAVGLAPAAKVEAARPAVAASPAEQKDAPPSRAWLGLGKPAIMFILSMVAAQIGVEAFYAALPGLIQKTFGDFTIVAQLSIVSSLASIFGSQLGPLAVHRFGLKRTYLGVRIVGLLTMSAMAGLLAVGHMTLPLMTVFYAFSGLVSGAALMARESIPPVLVGQDNARIEKYWTWEQTITEIIGISGPIVTGAIVARAGFLPALIAYPLSMLVSIGIVMATLRLPKGAAEPEAKPAESAGREKGFFEKIAQGAILVWKTPALRYSFLAYTVFMTTNPYLYTLIGPAYGLRIAATEELATAVTGWLTGLYSLGGLIGGFVMMRQQKRLDADKAAMRARYEAEHGAVSDEEWERHVKPWESETLRGSLKRWLLLGTLGLTAFATFAFPLPTLGALVALPAGLGWLGSLSLPALAMVPFGMAQVASVLKLRSFFQARVPGEDSMSDAMGFFSAASLAADTVGLLALKYLFAVQGFTPFVVIAAAMVPFALFYLYLRGRLDKLSR